jgi:hypothetical protein
MAVCTSETSFSVYDTTQRNIPEAVIFMCHPVWGGEIRLSVSRRQLIFSSRQKASFRSLSFVLVTGQIFECSGCRSTAYTSVWPACLRLSTSALGEMHKVKTEKSQFNNNQSPEGGSRAASRNVVYIKYISENGQCPTHCFYNAVFSSLLSVSSLSRYFFLNFRCAFAHNYEQTPSDYLQRFCY